MLMGCLFECLNNTYKWSSFQSDERDTRRTWVQPHHKSLLLILLHVSSACFSPCYDSGSVWSHRTETWEKSRCRNLKCFLTLQVLVPKTSPADFWDLFVLADTFSFDKRSFKNISDNIKCIFMCRTDVFHLWGIKKQKPVAWFRISAWFCDQWQIHTAGISVAIWFSAPVVQDDKHRFIINTGLFSLHRGCSRVWNHHIVFMPQPLWPGSQSVTFSLSRVLQVFSRAHALLYCT